MTISPGTNSAAFISINFPSRFALVFNANDCFKASKADSARTSSTNPIVALMNSRARIIPKSTQSCTIAATIHVNSIK